MKLSPLRIATFLALGTALISGANIFLTKIVVTAVNDPLVFTTLKNGIVAIMLIGLLVVFHKWQEIRSLRRDQLFKLGIIGVVGGSLPFILFFTGIMRAGAVSAGLIHKTLFLWVLLFAYPFLKERLTKMQWLGIGAIFAANLLIGGFSGFSFGVGELMILGATILWAVENVVAKLALKDVSSLVVASSRMVLGSFILLGVTIATGRASVLAELSFSQMGGTLLTSLLLLGYVTTWYAALKRAPASYVAALLVPSTLVTNVLSAVFITHTLTTAQLTSSTLYLMGIALMVFFVHRTADVVVEQNKAGISVA